MSYLKYIFSALVAVFFIALPSLANAQFEPSDARLFVDWPQLEADPMPGQSSESMIYAVIDGDIALYTIAVQNRFNIAVLGSFQCNKEFTLLKSQSNGFYDIRCADKNVFNETSIYILQFGKNGQYIQNF